MPTLLFCVFMTTLIPLDWLADLLCGNCLCTARSPHFNHLGNQQPYHGSNISNVMLPVLVQSQPDFNLTHFIYQEN